jgi:RHS repeat-associated protein
LSRENLTRISKNQGRSEWLPEGGIDSTAQGRHNGEMTMPEYRYTGINATLYANGEAVAVNWYSTETFTGGTAYLGKDIMGSVRSVTGEYGVPEGRYEYDAFSKPYKGDLAQGMNLGYTGKPYDTVTGLYNYGYRDYAPEVARFTTADPVRDGANWFAYVNNDPVNWVDPWGLSASDDSKNSNKDKGTNISDGDRDFNGSIRCRLSDCLRGPYSFKRVELSGVVYPVPWGSRSFRFPVL